MPDRADLVIYQGDDYNARVTVTGALPPDQVITGYAAKAQIRDDVADSSTEVIEMLATVGSPYVTLNVPKAVTVDMCQQYVWDLELTSPDGTVTTVLAGNVRVIQEVTRETTNGAASKAR